jgi:hypothetical protein
VNEEYPKVPELDKITENREVSQAIGSFLDWLEHEAEFGPKKGDGRKAAVRATKLNNSPVRLCIFDDDTGEWEPVRLRIEEMLGLYFEIDLDKAEKERLAVLDWVREQNATPEFKEK